MALWAVSGLLRGSLARVLDLTTALVTGALSATGTTCLGLRLNDPTIFYNAD